MEWTIPNANISRKGTLYGGIGLTVLVWVIAWAAA